MSEPKPLPSVRVLRWVLVGLSCALALVLLLRGNVLIGGLLAALVATRVVLLVQLRRRRNELRARWQPGAGSRSRT